MKYNIPRLMIAAPNSGSGKTTVTCGILKAFLNKNVIPAAFKSGPDYIDPMFHSKVIGAKSRNLDVFMLGEDTCRYLLYKNSLHTDIAVLEGAMGYYDGIGKTAQASAYNLAAATKTPVVLVINGKGAALSLAAQIKGFKEFRPDSNICAAIINNVNAMSYLFYKDVIEAETGIKLVGYMPTMENCGFESRHLGLVTAEEIHGLQSIVERLADQALKSIDFEALQALAVSADELEVAVPAIEKIAKVKIAVAQDKAFCFYYQDALDLLAQLGAEIVPFSPLKDKQLPNCDGIFLGGGYPELYAEQLANNFTMLVSIKQALAAKIPCIAECGGFMYLLEHYTDSLGKSWPWVGGLAGEVTMTKKLNRFGYITLEAKHDGLLALQGEKINGHEFHYSESTLNGEGFKIKKASGRGEWEGINTSSNLYAGYPHIHLWGNPQFARKFIEACQSFKDK